MFSTTRSKHWIEPSIPISRARKKANKEKRGPRSLSCIPFSLHPLHPRKKRLLIKETLSCVSPCAVWHKTHKHTHTHTHMNTHTRARAHTHTHRVRMPHSTKIYGNFSEPSLNCGTLEPSLNCGTMSHSSERFRNFFGNRWCFEEKSEPLRTVASRVMWNKSFKLYIQQRRFLTNSTRSPA